MNMDDIPPDVVFSLVCESCDVGTNIDSYEQAIAQGWTLITCDLELPMANFVGLCPDCKREESRRDKARRKKAI
jgi:hypothetical protein